MSFDGGLSQVAKNSDGPLARRVLPCAPGDADRRRPHRRDPRHGRAHRPPRPPAVLHRYGPGRRVRNPDRQRAAHPGQGDAHQALPAGRGGGSEGAGQDPLPADLLHPARRSSSSSWGLQSSTSCRTSSGSSDRMPRLLLVARNPSLAFGLASASDDIIEVRPALVGRLAISPGMADVVVIEQEKPADALVTLDLIRAGGLLAPALLVASSRAEWASLRPRDPARRSPCSTRPSPRTGSASPSARRHGLPDAPEPVAEPTPEPAAADDSTDSIDSDSIDSDSGSWLDDEATPIAAAAAAVPSATDDALPDAALSSRPTGTRTPRPRTRSRPPPSCRGRSSRRREAAARRRPKQPPQKKPPHAPKPKQRRRPPPKQQSRRRPRRPPPKPKP